MSLVTAAELQALGVGVGLAEADLQAVIDREAAELTQRYGDPTAERTETVRPRGRNISLTRPISAVRVISEYRYLGDTAPVTLTTTDYEIWSNEGQIERITTAAAWGPKVAVTYTPIDDTDLRTSVLTELVRIAVEQASSIGSGGGSVSGLGYRIAAGKETPESYDAARQAQYKRMRGWLS